MTECLVEMPKYMSTKTVWALKISSVGEGSLSFEEAGYAPVQVGREWLERHKPEAGGYYVTYKDGYKSYSPASAFEEGNVPFDPEVQQLQVFFGEENLISLIKTMASDIESLQKRIRHQDTFSGRVPREG